MNLSTDQNFITFLVAHVVNDVPALWSWILSFPFDFVISLVLLIAFVIGVEWLGRHRNVAYAAAAAAFLSYVALLLSTWVDGNYRQNQPDDAFFGLMLALVAIGLGVIMALSDKRISKETIDAKYKRVPLDSKLEADLKTLLRKIKADLDDSALVATVLGVPAIAVKVYPDKDLQANFSVGILSVISHASTLFLILGGLLAIYSAIMKRRISRREMYFYGES